MINQYFLWENTDKLLICFYFWSACSSPKEVMQERVKWIKIARGRFSSAAGKRAKDEKLESPRSQRREGCRVGGDTERRAGSARTCAAMRNMDRGGWSAQAVSRVGQGEGSKPEERANWSNYYLIKSQPWESREQSVTPKFSCQKEWSNMLTDQRRWHRWQKAGRGKDDQKRAVFLCKQEAGKYRKAVDLDHSGDLQIMQQ